MILAERITSEWTYQQSRPVWHAVAVWSRPILCLPSNTSPTKHKHSKHNHCVRLSIKRLVQYHTGTCTNLNKTRFLQKMMFFAIITSNIDLDRGVFVKIHAIYVPLIYDNCKAFIITEMQFLLFNTFFWGGGWVLRGVMGGGINFLVWTYTTTITMCSLWILKMKWSNHKTQHSPTHRQTDKTKP